MARYLDAKPKLDDRQKCESLRSRLDIEANVFVDNFPYPLDRIHQIIMLYATYFVRFTVLVIAWMLLVSSMRLHN